MSDTRTVAVKLQADVNGYRTSMKQAAQSTDKLDQAQAKAQNNTRKWEAIGVASQVAGAAVAAGLVYATKAASNQEQAVGALTATFKVNGAAMKANADKASDLGLSITDYSNAAAKLGGQLSNLGVDQKDLGGITDDLIGKAADLAAQYGGSTSEAVDALGAAMRGEADPAERYSLALNATAVNAEMLATGGDKAQAILSLINEQMAKSGAAGAMSREYDTAAASMERAKAQFDNATAALGEGLLPVMAQAADAASKLLGVFNGMPDPLKKAVTYIVAIGGTALLVGPRIATMTSAVINLRKSMEAGGDAATATTSKVKGFAATAGKIAAVGGAAAIAIPLLTELLNALTTMRFGATTTDAGLLEQQIIRLAQTGNTEIGRFGGSIDGLGESLKLVGSEGWSKWGEVISKGGSQLKTTEEEVGELDATLGAMVSNGNADQAALAFDQLVQQTIAAGGSAEDVTNALPAYTSALESAKVAAGNSADASYRDAEAKENQAQAIKKAVTQYEAYLEAVQQALGLLSARDALIGQEDRLTTAIKENGTALRGRTKAAANNRAAIAEEVSSISTLVDETYKNVTAKKGEAEGLRAANRVRRNQIQALMDSAAAAGFDRDQTRALLKQLNLLKPIKTTVKVGGLEFANRQAAQLAASLDDIVQKSGLGRFGFGLPGHATGGYISGPGTGTSDSIPAMLSDGEYVMTAKATKRLGVDRLNAMNYARGGLVGYARGGSVNGGGGGGAGQANLAVGAGRALRQVEKWREAVKAARENVRDLRKQAKEYAATVASNVLSAGGPGLFESFTRSGIMDSWKNLAAAQDGVADASRRVYDAQVKVNTASPEGRAAAIAELADAQRDLADAQGEQTAAEQAAAKAAPTAEGILGRMRERARLVVEYGTKVKSLLSKGLSMALIKDLAGADPIEAGPVLDALLKMNGKQLKELGALDSQARSAAASVGKAVSKKVNKKDMKAANIELTASSKGLDKAIKAADRTIDKQWRKKLANAGLGAEERVELLQSIRDNDGKLTAHWRNVLAKAGLSAEERGDLLDSINGADTVLTAHWRNKLAAAGLSAEDRGDLMQSLIANDGKLTREWRDKLAAAGLSAAERNNLITNGIRDADTKARVDWANNDYAADLDARKENAENKLINVRGDATNWRNSTYATDIDARKENAEAKLANVRTDAKVWSKAAYASALDARKEDAETKLKNIRADADKWRKARYDTTIGARPDLVAARRAMYDVAMAAYTVAKATWRPPLKAPVKPNRRDYGLATGGLVLGAGTSTSDSIPVRLSNGEYVIRASSVKRYGADLMDAINMGRFASGGPVGFRTISSPPAGGANGLTLTTSTIPVVVQLDNRTLATGQLKLRRQSGGTVTLGG